MSRFGPFGRFQGPLLLAIALLLTSPGWCHTEKEDTTLTITVQGARVSLHYFTKFPAMSAFVRLKQLDANGDGQYSESEKEQFLRTRLDDFLARARLDVQGTPAKLSPLSQKAEVGGDALGLHDLAVEYTVSADLPSPLKQGDSFTLHDPAFGWNRFTVTSDDGRARANESTAGETLTVAMTDAPSNMGRGGASTVDGDERLVSMLGGQMTPTVLLTTLGLAFVLGALHALTPGHGKTMVAAYLVGSRGTVSQAVLLGLVVTVTHTASVFLLGIGCMVAFQYVVPDKIIPWIGFVSGLMVTAVGATLLIARATGKEWGHGHSHDHEGGHSHGHSHSSAAQSHSHSQSHSHASAPQGHSHSHDSAHGEHSHAHDATFSDHERSHSLAPPRAPRLDLQNVQLASEPNSGPIGRQVSDAPAEDKVSLWALIGLGISGGLVPCPEALVVLLSALSLNKLLLGMMVLVAFSAGLASLLVLIGILVVSATRMSKRYYPSDETIRKISMVSYVVICGLGLVIALRSLISGGVITLNL